MTARKDNINRADLVRARHKIEPARRKSIPKPFEPTQRERESAAHVTVRRYTSGIAQPASSAYSRHRRKVYLPAETPGSELRLPAIPVIKVGWRLLSTLLVILLGFGIYVLKFSPTFTVSELTLNGAQRILAEEILDKLNLQGEPIIELIPAEIESQILADFPDIKAASVSIELPANLTISIEERIPAITWYNEENPSYWVDENGYTFPIRGEATIPMAVHATGDPPQNFAYAISNAESADGTGMETSLPIAQVDPQFVISVLKLRNIIPAGTELLYDSQKGLGWTDQRGWKVYLGTDTSQIDLKLAEYQKIVDAILARNLQPVLISVEYIHAPYYRLE